jgi:transcriptional regulator GlxA family with amidase domain
MERVFVERYGLTPHAYHTRVRIRAAVLLLHGSSEKVEYVARRTGYAGVGNFYTALETCTTMSPGMIRKLDERALGALLRHSLEIDIARLREQIEPI